MLASPLCKEVDVEENEVLLSKLDEAACEAADYRALGMMPHPSRRSFVDALQAALDAGMGFAELTERLANLRPDDFLVLAGPTLDLLTSAEGLGIAAEDLPVDAMEYLSLVAFLNQEMGEGYLPYHNFGEMRRAAAEGRTLAQGLARRDRERLIRARIEPELRRLWPKDEDRVAEEIARLFDA